MRLPVPESDNVGIYFGLGRRNIPWALRVKAQTFCLIFVHVVDDRTWALTMQKSLS